jgi:hypothetical protein
MQRLFVIARNLTFILQGKVGEGQASTIPAKGPSEIRYFY